MTLFIITISSWLWSLHGIDKPCVLCRSWQHDIVHHHYQPEVLVAVWHWQATHVATFPLEAVPA